MTVAFIPVTFGYGTTMRCLAVALELRRRGHHCVFLAGLSVHAVIRRYGFPVRAIPDVAVQQRRGEIPACQLFAQESAPGFLARQKADTIKELADIRAEGVVYSNNLSAAISASALDLPSVSIFAPSIVGISSLSVAIPMMLTWLRFVLLHATTHLARPVPSPFIGTRTFIPSLPPLVHWPRFTTPGLALHRAEAEPVGALLLQPPSDLPPSGVLRDELQITGSPVVYASVGGAIFDVTLVREIADGIRGADCSGLVSGGRIVTSDVSRALSDDRVQVVPYIPDDFRAIKAADALIWHGGQQTMMEAVACGTPAIGLPFQLDQFANVASLANVGAALTLNAHSVRAEAVTSALQHILHQPRIRQRMEALRLVNGRYRGALAVADAVEQLQSLRALRRDAQRRRT